MKVIVSFEVSVLARSVPEAVNGVSNAFQEAGLYIDGTWQRVTLEIIGAWKEGDKS